MMGSYAGSGSPHTNTNSSGGSGARPRNIRNHSSTAYPVTHPVNPAYSTYQTSQTGSMSRSASRARPNAKDAVGVPPLVTRKTEEEEDDEAEVVDRGADLIRKRQRERKQARKKKEKERRKAEEGGGAGGGGEAMTDVSAPPTGISGGESFATQQSRAQVERSTSRSRLPSSTTNTAGLRAERTGSESYFGSSWSSSITPQGPLSPRDDIRPPSTYASTVDENDDDDEPRQTASVVDEVINNVVEQDASQGRRDDDDDGAEEDEDEDSGENEDDEGVTLKDRQDVSHHQVKPTDAT